MAEKVIKNGKRYYQVDNNLYPSVTTILGETMPIGKKIALKRWRDKQTREGKNSLDAANRGTRIHCCIEAMIDGDTKKANRILANDPEVRDYLSCAYNLLVHIMAVVPIMVETQVISHSFRYAGTIDYLGQVIADGSRRRVLFDWKSSEKTKTRTDCEDYFIQAAAYTRALKDAGVKVDSASICVFYPNSQPDIFNVSDVELTNKYWEMFLERREQFEELTAPKPIMPDDVFAGLIAQKFVSV